MKLPCPWNVAVIYSGIDWSGSPGPAHGPWLVIAVVHIDEVHLPTLDAELARVRKALGVSDDFVFRHNGSSVRTKREFFAAIARVPLHVRVHMLNKARWSAQYVKGSTGTDCTCDGIVELIAKCPRECIDWQLLYIDLHPDEKQLVERYRTTIRQAMRRAGQPAFKDMKPRPDERRDGAIIQVADMMAGEVRREAGLAGAYLPALRSRMEIV
jgi:hypothetical protein